MRWAVLAALFVLLGSMACATGTENAKAAPGPAELSIPGQILGLRVVPEDVQGQLGNVKRPYVDTVAVFSLRDEDLLRASLQVSRFNRAARPEDADFRRDIVSTIGGSAQNEYRVGDDTVYTTSASDQIVFVWFERNGMFVLAVQRDFPFPRTLVRRLVSSRLRA